MRSFTEELLSQLENERDALQMIISRIREEQSVCIWGTGVAGQMIFTAAKKRNLHIDSFVDGTETYIANQQFMGIPVTCPNQIPAGALIIIAADYKYRIHERIEKQFGNSYCYVDPHMFRKHTIDTKTLVMETLSSNREEIDYIYNRLCNERSKQTLRNVLIHRAVHRIDLLQSIIDRNQYFGNDIIPSVNGCFVDCGAYTGDTLKAFLSQIIGDYKYYAFEPEDNNYHALQAFIEKYNLQNVHLYPIGLWDKRTSLQWLKNEPNDSLAWGLNECIDGSLSSVQADSLDHVLKNRKADFIKMDIEGAELKALEGAKDCIKQWKPKMAISAYHELNHLWKVPEKMLELNPDINLFYLHHSWNVADTVCYGV